VPRTLRGLVEDEPLLLDHLAVDAGHRHLDALVRH
jgi:hypothetical protein